MVLLSRWDGDPLQLLEPLKGVVRALDANLPISEMRTYEDLYRYNAVEGPQVGIELVGAMGAVSLLLAVTGSLLRSGRTAQRQFVLNDWSELTLIVPSPTSPLTLTRCPTCWAKFWAPAKA